MATERQRARNIILRPITNLLLDPENPRITPPAGSSQRDLLRLLYESEALEELAVSLARNGYFSEEPLVVVPHERERDQYVVVEGNRRLAAIRILLDPRLRRQLGVVDWPALTPDQVRRLTEVPTVEYASRAEVIPYLGFRHITGIKTWDPFPKARYVAQLIDSGREIESVEEAIGDSARTVRRLYQSYVVYNQIISDLGMDPAPVRKYFSLLEVALSQQSIRRFLGLQRGLPTGRIEELVPDVNLPALREVVSWVFGDPESGEDRLITDSRQIQRQLSTIIANSESLEYLRKNRDLEGAYEFSGGEKVYLLRQLSQSRRAAQRALGVLPPYKGDNEVKQEIERLEQIVDALLREVA